MQLYFLLLDKILSHTIRICFICHQIGAVLGAWLGGKFFDMYGNYENMWWLSVLLGIIAFFLTITVKEKAFLVNSELKQLFKINYLGTIAQNY